MSLRKLSLVIVPGALVAMLGIATAQAAFAGGEMQSSKPDTELAMQASQSMARNRLVELVEAINGPANVLPAFAKVHPGLPPPPDISPSPPTMLQMLLETRHQSQSLEIVRFTRVTKSQARALVRSKLTRQLSELIVMVEDAPPHRIDGWGFDLLVDQSPETAKSDAEREKELRSYLNRLARADAFSGVVMIAKDGKVVFEQHHGFADRDRRIPITANTEFRLASLSKVFTGLAIGRLVEQGRLSYDDPIGKFVPGFPDRESADKIRIKHLLSHTSGLPGFAPPAIHNAQKGGSSAVGIKALGAIKPQFEPGTRWDYSNTGFLLLGRVIEVVTGETYFDYMKRNFLAPLKLTKTSFPNYESKRGSTALPYEYSLRSNGRLTLTVPAERTLWAGPAGDAAASAGDLTRLATLLESGTILSKAGLQLHATPKPELNSPAYGYAFDLNTPKRDIYGHSGGGPGTCTQLGVMRDLPSRYSFVVLSNGPGGTCRPVVMKIVSLFSPKGPR